MHNKLVIAQAIRSEQRAAQHKRSAYDVLRSGQFLVGQCAIQRHRHLHHGQSLGPCARLPGHLLLTDKCPAQSDSGQITAHLGDQLRRPQATRPAAQDNAAVVGCSSPTGCGPPRLPLLGFDEAVLFQRQHHMPAILTASCRDRSMKGWDNVRDMLRRRTPPRSLSPGRTARDRQSHAHGVHVQA
jgi:hypothetical protein